MDRREALDDAEIERAVEEINETIRRAQTKG
jgi:hypothetical protein